MLCIYVSSRENPSFSPAFLGARLCNLVSFPASSTSRLFAAPVGDDDAEEEDDENDDDDSSSSSSAAFPSSAASSSTFKGKHRRALRSLAGTLYLLLVLFFPSKSPCMYACFRISTYTPESRSLRLNS